MRRTMDNVVQKSWGPRESYLEVTSGGWFVLRSYDGVFAAGVKETLRAPLDPTLCSRPIPGERRASRLIPIHWAWKAAEILHHADLRCGRRCS